MNYLVKRLLLIPPTLLGILFLNFLIVQLAPGGPVDQMIAQLQGNAIDPSARLSGAVMEPSLEGEKGLYRGAEGLSPEIIAEIERLYGFDQPFWTRFVTTLQRYVQGDLGVSYFRGETVGKLIWDRLPVSMSLGLWSTLILYGACIPLGIAKALRQGSLFDVWTSVLIIIGYAIPGFLFALLLIILFAGGSFFSFFPLRGLVSENWQTLSWGGKIADYLWHMTLPLLTQLLGGFAALTLLTKNAFLEEISKNYVTTARAKGLSERAVLWRHVFQNASLVLVSRFPASFLHLFFTGALFVEIVFSLDGLGLLGFTATVNRDYPVIFGTLFVFTLLGLLLHVVGDMLYVLVDPRISFNKQKG
jgi:microcin C transport system permease protein